MASGTDEQGLLAFWHCLQFPSSKALFMFSKNFIQYQSHQIFGDMHGALNAVEKNN